MVSLINPKTKLRYAFLHRIWFYNVDQEQLWNNTKVFPSVRDRIEKELFKRQELQLLLMADEEDLVLFQNHIDGSFVNCVSMIKAKKTPKLN